MKLLSSFVCASCRRTLTTQPLRTTTTTTTAITHALPRTSTRTLSSTPTAPAAEDAISRAFNNQGSRPASPFQITSFLTPNGNTSSGPPSAYDPGVLQGRTQGQPHRFHVYATKHNTHITFTQPPQKNVADSAKVVDVLMSMSAGNIGFRKSGRGSYDAAYQLGAFVLKQIQERGLLRDITGIEVVLRGFGPGREAVSKVLLGQEGRLIRNKIVSIKDATRLKFGGPRSPNPRRLG